ncbi:DUF6538 domain-containing protein [Marinobacterium stanieri]|uniref:DUF6538 domain-containing protein n=1 Tax=Marinobacterium stanieri TaxID=49186 RepID=A0A1N6QAR5_9GAMM|nr:DUF6538 domain-containing protein [Marinobacterium stanieri]SIQ13516.1 hypothetical protein SAMN05421647_102374 [Marinobacterium stanieri]
MIINEKALLSFRNRASEFDGGEGGRPSQAHKTNPSRHKPADIRDTEGYGVNFNVNFYLNAAMSDTKYLVQRKGIWLCNWRVPKDCAGLFNGKKMITKSLGTHKLPEAYLKTLVSLTMDTVERAQATALQNVHAGVQHDLTPVMLEATKLHHDDNEGKLKINALGQINTAVERFLTTIDKDQITLKPIGRLMVKDFMPRLGCLCHRLPNRGAVCSRYYIILRILSGLYKKVN